MVTVLEMSYFAIGALCFGGFSNCEHGETRVEDLQVPLYRFQGYWAFLPLIPSSSVRDKLHASLEAVLLFCGHWSANVLQEEQRPKAGPAQRCAGRRFVLSS